MTEKTGNPSGGEPIDRAARDAVQLAYQALERFPELVRRHKFIAGGAAVSTSLIVLAGVAIARRMRLGQTSDEALASVTEGEMQGQRMVVVEPDEDAEADPDAQAEDATTTPADSTLREGEAVDTAEPAAPAPAADGTTTRPNLTTVPSNGNGTGRTEVGHH
ncbi:MAG: hypothetical protein DWI59_03840 [Chloroflexi bacterium]|nr:MAG: hypothetical protein DWI59_03840 [Chloroflexota bacterium]